MINSEITKIVLRKLFLLGLYVLGVAATCPASPTPSGNQSENQPSPPTETVARLVPDTPPIKNVLPKSARGIHILGGKWEIKYERHVSFELTSSSSRTYLIEALCEQENLGLAILDSERHVLEVGLGVETRLLRKSIKIDLNPDTKYTVVVGTRSL
jgi:hypothetical protein